MLTKFQSGIELLHNDVVACGQFLSCDKKLLGAAIQKLSLICRQYQACVNVASAYSLSLFIPKPGDEMMTRTIRLWQQCMIEATPPIFYYNTSCRMPC